MEPTVSDEDMAKTPTAVKEVLGVVKTLRSSFRKATERTPLSSGKRSKVKRDSTDGTCPPPSPSPSAGSPLVSPLRITGGFFQKKDEDKAECPSQKNKGLSRSNTDPNIGASSLFHKGATIRRSLFGTRKEKKEQQLVALSEGSAEESRVNVRDAEGSRDKEEVLEEMEEMYVLPELPHTPLSVMQINKLIESDMLEEAHLNLLALRLEFQQELSQCEDDAPVALVKKEKDLNLLYSELRKKLCRIVRDSNSLLSSNKALLVPVARIVQEEERRASDPGALSGSWMNAWRDAVQEGVQAKVELVQLENREQNTSWLAVHLALLGKSIVDDLESVRRELRWSYPPSFKVFSAYVQSYHRVLGQHLKKLEEETTEVKDLHVLLNWIINRYKSESIMGHVSLQADMKDESKELHLEPGFLTQLKDKYCARVKEEMHSSLENIIKLENDEFWKDRKDPEKEEGLLISDIHMDIWTQVKGFANHSRTIEAELEQRVCRSCLEELIQFPKRFEQEFRRRCIEFRPQPLWSRYHITYSNTFTTLQHHMENYRASCPAEVEAFSKEVRWLCVRLLQDLEDQFKDDVKIYLRRMMTRKWLTNDEDFQQLYKRTELLSQHCALMKPPSAQEFASQLHLHVTQEYIGQLMMNNYSCKNRKHEKAAGKMRSQWHKLQDLFRNMGSSHEWLYPLGDQLCDIIGQKHTSDIKDLLEPLVEHYPDFGKKHLVGVLWFRGLVRGQEHQLILQRLSKLQETAPTVNKSRALFSDLHVTVNTDCFSNLPVFCFSFVLPQN